MSQRILILGGGFAGMFAAREIRKRLGDSVSVELINADNYFMFQPLLPEVAAGSITAPHAVTPLRMLLRGVFFRMARVAAVDVDRQIVTVFQGVQRRPTDVPYDHLVVALGQEVDLSRIPGLSDHALKMKTLSDARQLRGHLIEKLEHAEVTNLPEVKREALTFCVIGAGFSGVETVGEMKEMIDRSIKFYPNISSDEIRVVVVEFADRVLGELPESLGTYAKKRLERMGVEIMLGRGVASATGTRLILDDGTEIETRTIVATIGNAPSDVVRDMPLKHQHGRISVERTLRAEGHDTIWSLGDCALIPLKDGATERTDFAPPTAQFAVREARCMAENLARAMAGQPLKPFAYTSKGALASLGAKRGVAEVMGLKLSGFPAWLLWRAYYLSFLPGFGTKLRVLMNWVFDAFAYRSPVLFRPDHPRAVRYEHFKAGDRIFEAGNRSDSFYTVIEGAVEVIYPDVKTDTDKHLRIEAGGHFGEGILVGHTRRRSTVRAKEDCIVLRVEHTAYEQVANAFPQVAEYFRQHMNMTYGPEWVSAEPAIRKAS